MLQTNTATAVDFNVHLGARPKHDGPTARSSAIENVNFGYGAKQALRDINLEIYEHEVTAFIGPSGCGKTTLLRCLNRSNDIVPARASKAAFCSTAHDIHDPAIDPPLLRRRFGWVAQKPNPFPWSIYSNVVYGPKIHGLVDTRAERDEIVERTLRRVGLWDEVKDRLGRVGRGSLGRSAAAALRRPGHRDGPEVILMDEPASALDPTATAKLEDLIDELRDEFTVVIITHNMQQAARVAQRVAFFHLGRLVEHGDTEKIFITPAIRSRGATSPAGSVDGRGAHLGEIRPAPEEEPMLMTRFLYSCFLLLLFGLNGSALWWLVDNAQPATSLVPAALIVNTSPGRSLVITYRIGQVTGVEYRRNCGRRRRPAGPHLHDRTNRPVRRRPDHARLPQGTSQQSLDRPRRRAPSRDRCRGQGTHARDGRADGGRRCPAVGRARKSETEQALERAARNDP